MTNPDLDAEIEKAIRRQMLAEVMAALKSNKAAFDWAESEKQTGLVFGPFHMADWLATQFPNDIAKEGGG